MGRKKRRKVVKKKKKNGKCKSRKNGGRIEKNYSLSSVQKALDAISQGKSLREAANNFGVPKSTLYRLNKGDVEFGCKKGAPTILTDQEEQDLVKWIIYCAERGFPVTKKQLQDTVKTYMTTTERENPFTNNSPGYKWYTSFLKRHPNISIRTAQNLTTTRASVTEDKLRQWFSQLEVYLEEKGLSALPPNRIFNLDETSFMLVPPNNNEVIAEKGARSVYKIVGGNEKSNLTVLITAAASGELLPPMILFDLKTTPRKEILEKIPKDWAVGNTEKGWMTSDSFYKYIVNVFYKWLVDNHYEFPVVLYADNHSSHMTMQLVKFCKEKNIELIGLYPNSTHIIQPLDVGLFHVLKLKYKENNNLWRIQNNIIDVKKYMFAEILKQTLDSYNFSNCIIKGFQACGLVPFNPDVVQYNILNKKKKPKQSSSIITHEISSAEDARNDNAAFLQKFEREYLTPDILNAFIINKSKESWEGNIKLDGLFAVWKTMLANLDNQSPIDVNNNGESLTATDINANAAEELDFNYNESLDNMDFDERITTINNDQIETEEFDSHYQEFPLTDNMDFDDEITTINNNRIETEDFDSHYQEFPLTDNMDFDEGVTTINDNQIETEELDFHYQKSIENIDLDQVITITNNDLVDIEQLDLNNCEIISLDDYANYLINFGQSTNCLLPGKEQMNKIASDKPIILICNSDSGIDNSSISDTLKNFDCDTKTAAETTGNKNSSNNVASLNSVFLTPEDSSSSSHDNESTIATVTNEKTKDVTNKQSYLLACDKIQNFNTCNDVNTEMSIPIAIKQFPNNIDLEDIFDDSTIFMSEDQSISQEQIQLKTESTILSKINTQVEIDKTREKANKPRIIEDIIVTDPMRKLLNIPEFKRKKKKVTIKEVTVNTVENVMASLQKKDDEKISKQRKIEMNKIMKEKKKALKEKEQSIKKSFQETKKKLNKQKQDCNSRLRALKKNIRDGTIQDESGEQVKTLVNELTNIEQELVNLEIQSLQCKIKVKQEQI